MTESGPAAPVRIVKDHTSITNGTEVEEKLIAAARVFSDILRPTFGPRGLDKMLYKTDGSMAVTNDGARINPLTPELKKNFPFISKTNSSNF